MALHTAPFAPTPPYMAATQTLADKQATASAWFRTLRDSICTAFESIEAAYAADAGGQAGTFTRTPWDRTDGAQSPSFSSVSQGGGGEMSVMKGTVFEKVGVNISTVHGTFSDQFRSEIPGADTDPRFWASGISLVAHMANPHTPAAHMNTRMIVVGDGARVWFGGGGDLNPAIPYHEDTAAFHAAFRSACDPVSADFYPAFAAWCDEYFFIPHRNMARGVGGIFYDYLGLARLGTDTAPVTSGRFGKGGLNASATQKGMEIANHAPLDWGQAFAFTQSVGTAFRDGYCDIVRQRMHTPFTDADRHTQLVHRGRYAEYNLLYDRGTRFGLMTGGNPEAILMSLPPVAVWE